MNANGCPLPGFPETIKKQSAFPICNLKGQKGGKTENVWMNVVTYPKYFSFLAEWIHAGLSHNKVFI